MDGLNTVLEYLTSVPAWYLATSVDGQPHVRPFSFAQIQDGKLWFVTARTKDVWQELLQNQRFEATSWWPGHGWLILRGRAGLDDQAAPDMREAGWKHLERLGEHYEGVTVRRTGQYGARIYLSIPSSECVWTVSMHEYAKDLRRYASFGAKVSTHFITTAAGCALVHNCRQGV